MHTPTLRAAACCCLLVTCSRAAPAAESALRPNLLSLFAFDDHTLPFKNNLKLTFETPRKHPANPVLARGPVGSVDAVRAQFYGSVIRVRLSFTGADAAKINFYAAYLE